MVFFWHMRKPFVFKINTVESSYFRKSIFKFYNLDITLL